MRVKFIQSMIGTPPIKSGDVLTIDDRTAKKLIAAGICVPQEEKEQIVEVAEAKPQVEKAQVKRRRKRK